MRAREFSESEGVDIAINHGAGEDLEDASSAWEHAAGSHDARRSLTREEKGRERKREEDRGYEGFIQVDRDFVSADPLDREQSSSRLSIFENRIIFHLFHPF